MMTANLRLQPTALGSATAAPETRAVSPAWYRQNSRSPTPTSFRPFSKSPEVTSHSIGFAGRVTF